MIRSECIRNASVTPRNTEYTKYDPPGAQVSDDALAQKYLLYTPPARLKLRYIELDDENTTTYGRISSVPSRSGGLVRLVLPLRFRMIIIDVIKDVTNQSTAFSTVDYFSHEV